MGSYGALIAVLVVAGLLLVGVVITDVLAKRAYALLALALLVVVGLTLLWPPILADDATCGLSLGDSIDLTAAIYSFYTLLLIGALDIAGLIEMAIIRRWRWLAGLLAASALMLVIPYQRLPGLGYLPGLGGTSCLFGGPNEFIRRDAYWLVGEAALFLVCAGYAVRATWLRARPAV